MYTFQDFENDRSADVAKAVAKTIREHKMSIPAEVAITADAYDRQMNTTIMHYVKWLWTLDGKKTPDFTASNQKLCSNFFNRLNVQRCTYSLGNGVTFETDGLKEKLGKDFDTVLNSAGYYALIHGVSFIFWNVDHGHLFKLTEFAPLWDEETGALRAGVRFWQIDPKKPVMAVLYEEDGFTKFKGDSTGSGFNVVEDKRPYRQTVVVTAADAEPEIIAEENYGSLPIVPLYGSRLKQSTLVGMRAKIDAYDLVASGFADNMKDCAEIYWIVNNAGGMDDDDLVKFRDRLKLQHIANVEDSDGTSVTPFTQEIPTAASTTFKQDIRNDIYADFGALDCSSISAAAKTATEINAAYQPMDENADDFEYQVIQAVQQILALQGIDDTPIFKRNRICNQLEQTQMIMMAANVIDDETILKKLPWLTPDEIDGILYRKQEDESERFDTAEETEPQPENVNG